VNQKEKEIVLLACADKTVERSFLDYLDPDIWLFTVNREGDSEDLEAFDFRLGIAVGDVLPSVVVISSGYADDGHEEAARLSERIRKCGYPTVYLYDPGVGPPDELIHIMFDLVKATPLNSEGAGDILELACHGEPR